MFKTCSMSILLVVVTVLYSSTTRYTVQAKPRLLGGTGDGTGMGGAGGRGAGIFEKLVLFNPELRMTTAKPNPHEPKKRRVRGEKFLEKYVTVGTTPTTTTTTTTTLSPEQIKEIKRKIQEKADPKNFLKKLKQLNLLGKGDQSSTSVNKDSTTVSGGDAKKVEEQVEDMHKTLHKKLEGCGDNSECFNSTCCFKADPTKRGECIVQPHRMDQRCSDLCGCMGTYDGIELECKIMEISSVTPTTTSTITKAEGNKEEVAREMMQCKQRELSKQEFTNRVWQKMKNGRNPSPRRNKRTQRKQRIMFV